MSIHDLSNYTSVSKYAKWIKEEKRRETWDETVNRSKQMMLDIFEDKKDIEEEYEFVRKKEVLASQRCMQFGGKPILQHNTKLYNCAASYCDRLSFFQEYFYILLCGTGAGFSVQLQHVDNLPNFTKKRKKGITLPKKKFTITDDIEGWANAAGVLMSSYFEKPSFPEYYNAEVEFDFSKIRKKGAELSFGIGKAPGPRPLHIALDKIKKKLDKIIEKKSKRLWSINAYDIAMYLADAVISGGVRRAATICLFSLEDNLMMKAKTGNWYYKYPQRARSNNTIMLLRDKTTKEQFNEIFEHTKQFGEPGFFWVDDLEIVGNPCQEIGFDTKLYLKRDSKELKEFTKSYNGPLYDRGDNEVGLSGWQFCNLTTINGSTCVNKTDFFKRCEIAARIGTRQATFTNFPYLGKITEEICKKEALLGVAISGIMHNAKLLLNPDVQQEGAKIVKQTNENYSKRFKINPASRMCCIKPDGNSSCLMGSNPGIIPCHSPKHFRIVQVNKEEHPYKHFKNYNQIACEESKWSNTGTDDIIRFPIEIKDKHAIFKNDISGKKLLEAIKSTYINWVLPGTVKNRCVSDKVTHNVSNTVHVKENEWNDVKNMLYDDRQYFGGVSFIPFKGDLDYAQAPYTMVLTKEEIILKYNIDDKIYLELYNLVKDAVDLWNDCDCLLGLTINDMSVIYKLGKKYCAEKFGLDNIKWFTYLLKDIWLLKRWEEITNNWKYVDYTNMQEDNSDIQMSQDLACAGGSCLL